MPKRKDESEKDLFGHPIKKRVSRLERLLTQSDNNSFTQRLERLRYVESIAGDMGIMGSLDSVLILQEAGWAFVNGAFISTIILAQAFIERRLQDFMIDNGLEKMSSWGTKTILTYCRKNNLISEFLLDKLDHLRQIRNPFAHLKPIDHPFTLGNRIFLERMQPDELIEKDAREALSLMYTMLLTRL